MKNPPRYYWKFFWLIFAACLATYAAIIFWALPRLQEYSGGLTPFDLRPFGYTHLESEQLVQGLGAEGREFYLDIQQVLDTAYPGLLALVLVMGIFGLAPSFAAIPLAIAAILGALFDYLENHSVAGLLRAGDGPLSAEAVATASQWTVLKSAFDTVAITGFLVFAVIRLVGRYWNKNA